jgi:pimeloyl-ACP methyl ester carboxylesterase
MKLRIASFALVLSLSALACGAADDQPSTTSTGSGGQGTGGQGTGGAGGAGPQPLSITWSACNLYTEGPTVPAECATVAVPLRWDMPSGKTINLFVKRLAAKSARRGSLWLLDGGPGAGGVGMEGVAGLIAKEDAGIDIYIPVHRGTGQSTKLVCPEQEDPMSEGGFQITASEWPACIDTLKGTWGDDLAGFNATEAARDVGHLIDAVKQPGDQVFVMGSSYGTYLANRYLEMYPAQATGIILGSVCPPDGCHLDEFDTNYDAVGANFLAQCGADATCSSYVGTDPRQRLADLYMAIENGHCPALADLGVDWRTLRKILGSMLNDWNYRLGIAPVIHRLERCDDADVQAFAHLVQALFGKPGDPPNAFFKAWSFALSNNITFSELWSDPPPAAADIVAAADATILAEGIDLDAANVFPLWPRYARDQYAGKWGDTDLPMLMFNGDLDPATPIDIAKLAGEHFNGPHQTFVTIPRAPHDSFYYSPVGPNLPPCGLTLVTSFLADPTAPLDTSCAGQIMPLHFAGASWLAQQLFGTDDMFDNP